MTALKQQAAAASGCPTSDQRSGGFALPKGYTKTRLYRIWGGMRQRCGNPNNASYPYYGGRGISICRQWLRSFVAFRAWALANGYSSKKSIDRINNDGNYEPSNCRWATPKQQASNTSRAAWHQQAYEEAIRRQIACGLRKAE